MFLQRRIDVDAMSWHTTSHLRPCKVMTLYNVALTVIRYGVALTFTRPYKSGLKNVKILSPEPVGDLQGMSNTNPRIHKASNCYERDNYAGQHKNKDMECNLWLCYAIPEYRNRSNPKYTYERLLWDAPRYKENRSTCSMQYNIEDAGHPSNDIAQPVNVGR